MEDFLFLFPFAFLALIVALGWSVNFYKVKRKTASWQSLAKSLDLHYIPGKLMVNQPHVEGIYRDHFVTIEAEVVNQGESSQTFTSVKVAFNSRYSADNQAITTNMNARDVISILDPNQLRYGLSGTITIQPRELAYQEADIHTSPHVLSSILDFLIDIATGYRQVAALGSEVIPALRSSSAFDDLLEPVARQLLLTIAEFTTEQYQWRSTQLICQDCLTTFSPFKESISFLNNVTYFGCRTCRQSRRYFQAKWVVLTLDSDMNEEIRQMEDSLYVNWLQRRTLCDFNEVHILNATDEDVERLAVLIGNDTDPKRSEQYEHMTCIVAPTCPLSENTLRILRRTFEAVVVD